MEKFFFFQIFEQFFLPSVFLLVFFILGTAFFKEFKKIRKTFLFGGIIIYYFFSITPIADLILLPLESQYEYNSELLDKISSLDTYVLLAGGLRQNNLSGCGNLGESTLHRTITTSQFYFKANKKPKIIISGNGRISPEKSESFFIGECLKSLNVSKEDIILEKESRNTYQSAKNIKKIVAQKPFLLITSAYHLPRSVYVFKKIGTNPIPFPADYLIKDVGKYNIFDFFPRPVNLKKINLAFHEYFGLLYYKIRILAYKKIFNRLKK